MTKRIPTQSPLWKVPVDQEVSEEVAFHLEMLTREFVDRGFDQATARRMALEKFGNPEALEQSCRTLARERDRSHALHRLVMDLRLDLRVATRQFVRRPGLFITLLVILTLGLGASISVFSLVQSILLAPPPFDDPSRIVTVWETQVSRDKTDNVVGPANFIEWRERSRAFSKMAGFITTSATLTGGDRPQRVARKYVTADYFAILDVAPLLGRSLVEDDFIDGADAVTVLSYGLWQDRFGGRSDVLGQVIAIDGTATEVVGVMPAGFTLDMGAHQHFMRAAGDLWEPLTTSESWRTARGRWLLVIARLAPDASVASAQAEMTTIAESLALSNPQLDADWSARVVGLKQQLSESARAPLWILFAAVLLIQLLVCINAAGLLVARASARDREIAVRTALGAGRARLIRQTLVEGGVVAVLAGTLGLFMAWGLLRAIASVLPAELATRQPLSLDPATIGFALATTLITIILLGLVPGLAVPLRPGTLLRSGSVGDGRQKNRLRSALVFSQVVAAVVLVFGAGLMVRTLTELLDVDPGFQLSNVASFSLALPSQTPKNEVFALFDRVMDATKALPGVTEVGAVTYLPLVGGGAGTSFYPGDRPEPDPGTLPVASIFVTRGRYFEALGIETLQGRVFDDRDQSIAAGDQGTIVVNQTLAREQWPDANVLGKEVFVSWGDTSSRRVIGVVADTLEASLDKPTRATIYFPHAQEPTTALSFVALTRSDPTLVLAAIPHLVAAIDPSLPTFDRRTLEDIAETSTAKPRLLARTISGLASLALLLAGLGIYGVAAASVNARRREIGLRLALGARPLGILRSVLQSNVALVLGAITTGIALSLVLARSLSSQLFQVEPTDLASVLITAGALLVCTIVALVLPANRAVRVSPTTALKSE